MYELLSGHNVPGDAVLVCIWKQHGRTFADVACTPSTADDVIAADIPQSVGVALRRAKELARSRGLSRIVVAPTHEDLWKPEWGDAIPDLRLELRTPRPNA
jgi:hypothetical protein